MTQGVENPEPLIVKREEYFNSPNIRTPADSQTLDEFKGIFTLSSPQPVYSPLKPFFKRGPMDVRSSPVQRVVNPFPANFSIKKQDYDIFLAQIGNCTNNDSLL